MKKISIVVAMVLFANVAKANEIVDEYIIDNYIDMPIHIQRQIDDLLEYGDRYKKTIFAIIHNHQVMKDNPSCHD